MIKLQELEKLIEVTLFTGYIEGERPVSLLIVADPESGKAELANVNLVGEFIKSLPSE